MQADMRSRRLLASAELATALSQVVRAASSDDPPILALLHSWRESWSPGERAWFEYHCFESMESCDADLWLHSHRQVTVLGGAGYPDYDAPTHSEMTPSSAGFHGYDQNGSA